MKSEFVIPFDNSLGKMMHTVFKTYPQVTDIRFLSDEVVRVRVASCRWSVLMATRDGKEEPVVTSKDQVYAMINGAFYGQEAVDVFQIDSGSNISDKKVELKWPHALLKHSLNPCYLLRDSMEDEGFRVRLSIKRVNMGEQVSVMARGLRKVPKDTLSVGLPIHVSPMIDVRSGIVVVCGPTGAGKSTTIAACLQEINLSRTAHIVTIEDPIEFQYDESKSFFTQREVGVDVDSFEAGVADALRDAPDVIVIGEIRNKETMLAAVRAGVSGHLVFCSMHAPTTVSALSKMAAYLDSEADSIALSNNLVAVIAQGLVVGMDGQSKHLVYELLDGRVDAVQKAVATHTGEAFQKLETSLKANDLGNRSMSMMQSLKDLVKSKKISGDDALALVSSNESRKELMTLGA